MSTPRFQGRLVVMQRVLPSYRVPFFDALAERCTDGLAVIAGRAQSSESVDDGGRLERATHVPVRNRYLLSGPLSVFWQPDLVQEIERLDPDLLVLQAAPRARGLGAAVEWMRRRERPVVGWGIGAPPVSGWLGPARRRVRRRTVRRLDALIAYGRRGASEYEDLGFPSRRIFVAPNAVAPRPPGSPPDRPAGFADGRPTVLFVGRLTPPKRVDLLVRACAALPEAERPRLRIVGDGPCAAEVAALARSVYPQATLEGSHRGAALERYLREADLFVLPGSGGLAMHEAMASGLPIVVADGDGTQDDLVRDENGWTVPPGDAEALAARLRIALSDPVRLRAMGRASHRIVRDEINLETMVDAFVSALARVREPG